MPSQSSFSAKSEDEGKGNVEVQVDEVEVDELKSQIK